MPVATRRGVARATPNGRQAASPSSDSSSTAKSNFTRKHSDYLVIAFFYLTLFKAGEHWLPDRTSSSDSEFFWSIFGTVGGFLTGNAVTSRESLIAGFAVYYVVTSIAMFAATFALWKVMKSMRPDTPTAHLSEQAKAIAGNFLILPLYQVLWDALICMGYTKVTTGNTSPTSLVRDTLLWVLVFELTWYTQHRYMHDNKVLWTWGHQYHHGWKRPEHMIGVTNFAFDHLVEPWVTMSSSFVPTLLFPSHWIAVKVVSFAYMLFAVLVHWDAFHTVSAYHLNHHYLVTKNYGSHIPIFDMIFGTYQWAEYTPKGRVTVPTATTEMH